MKFHEQVCWNFRQLRGYCSGMQWGAKSSSSFYLTLAFGFTVWFGRAVIVFFCILVQNRTELTCSSRKTNLLAFPHISIVIVVFFPGSRTPVKRHEWRPREGSLSQVGDRQTWLTNNTLSVHPVPMCSACVYDFVGLDQADPTLTISFWGTFRKIFCFKGHSGASHAVLYVWFNAHARLQTEGEETLTLKIYSEQSEKLA